MGSLRPPRSRSFPSEPVVLSLIPSPHSLRNEVHPLVRFTPLQSSPVSCPPRIFRPRVPSMGLQSPSSRHQSASSLRRAPKPTAYPSSTFLTSSTVWSDSDLRGFISPHNHVQGSLYRVFPSSTAVTPRRCPVPSRRLAPSRYRRLPDSATTRRPALRAFLRTRVRCPTTVFSRRLTRFPLELLLLQVFPLRAVRVPSHPHPFLAFYRVPRSDPRY